MNLLGEHTDYNQGLCLPIAVHAGVECAAAVTDTGRVRLVNAQRPGLAMEFPLDTLTPNTVEDWPAYVLGGIWALRQDGHEFTGLDLAFDSDLPEGSGLSSSAALECATVCAAADLLGLALSGTRIAQLAQQAENEFVGVPCGLMDQMASVMSRIGHALLFDAGTLITRHVPLNLRAAGLELLVLDTRAPHQLSDGDYATRRQECERAGQALGVASLREVSFQILRQSSARSLGPTLLRRARHVVTEIARVQSAVEALGRGDVAALGVLMTQSHASLRDDFEVTVPELDIAVQSALESGALGARMTGAGFGGSIIALVRTGRSAAVAASIESTFAAAGWAEPRWFEATAAAGARRSDVMLGSPREG